MVGPQRRKWLTHSTFSFTQSRFELLLSGPPQSPNAAIQRRGNFSLFPTKTPKEMVLHVLASDQNRHDLPVLYALKGDELRIALQSGAPPKSLESTPGSNITLLVFSRETPQPSQTPPVEKEEQPPQP